MIEYVKDTFEEYLSNDSISASDIKSFLKSPAKFRYNKLNPDKKESAKHFAIGSALHELILEPELFNSHYYVMPKCDLRTKAGKQEYSEALAKADGKVIINDEDLSMITQMAISSSNKKTFLELIRDSYREVSAYTTDEKTGLRVKFRPDSLSTTKSTIVDIKTCVSSSPRDFRYDILSYGYHISSAYYSDFLGRENYVFCAIEKTAPYQTSLYQIDDEFTEMGRLAYRKGLDLLKWSIDNDFWCDYNQFEILKECYDIDNLEIAMETILNSVEIDIINK